MIHEHPTTWAEAGIVLPPGATSEIGIPCPHCSAERKKQNKPDLKVNVEKRTWFCHHCGWKGGLANGRDHGINLADLATDKAVSVKFLRELGLHNLADGGVGIPYRTADGKTAYVKRRTALKAGEGSFMPKGSHIMPYGMERLQAAREAGYVVLVEGESDCWTLWSHGYPAFGIPGAKAVKVLQAEHLDGIGKVYAVQETDEAGASFIQGLSKRFSAIGYRGTFHVLHLHAKDPNELHKRDPNGFKAAFEAALKESEYRRGPEKAQGARSDPGPGDSASSEEIDTHVPAPRPDEAMLYGLAGDVGRIAAETTEANPYAVAVGYLTFLSAACGRDIYLPVGNTWHHPRLYALHVGRSGRGRKGEALSLTHRIRHAIEDQDKDLLGQTHTGGLSSREGLAFLIHDGYKEGKKDIPPIHDKRLWIVESEFSNVLHQSKRDGNTLSSALRDAWDGISIKPAVKLQRLWATDPHIALSGQITPAELREVIEHRELTNGFANRFLIFWAEREKLIPFPKATPPETVQALAERTQKVIQFAKGQYPHTKDRRCASLGNNAAKLYERLYLDELAQPLESELLSALLERRAPYLLHLALLFALTDQTLKIEEKHIEAALAWVRYWSDSVRFIFSAMMDVAATEERRAVAEKILTYVRKHSEADRRMLINDCFAKHVSAGQIDAALTALLADTPPQIELDIQPRRDGHPGKKRSVYRLASKHKGGHSGHSGHSCESGENLSPQSCGHSGHSSDAQDQADDLCPQSPQSGGHSESLVSQLSPQSPLCPRLHIEKEPDDSDPEEVF